MEGHNDMDERRENSANVVIGESREDENEIISIGDNNEGAPEDEPSKRIKRNRPTSNQLQELEAAFKRSTHLDGKALGELATKLSMDYKQVKYWFQNKRARRKSQLNCKQGKTLNSKNDKLRTESIATKEAIRNPICDRCNGQAIVQGLNVDEYQARVENAKLRHEVKSISDLAEKYVGPIDGILANVGTNIMNVASQEGVDSRNGLSRWPTISLTNEGVIYDKSMLMNYCFTAMDELLKLAVIGEPLWVRSLDGGGEMLNFEEYARLFTSFTCMKSRDFRMDATRASGIVVNNSPTLVETLMDKNLWVEMFPSIIGKVSTFNVISTDIGGSKSGIILSIKVELRMISDLVPVRETTFLRYCHQHAKDMWIIVDFSVDTIKEGSQQYEIKNCRRLPSGCVVEDMLNGYSKVTWIEHMEYNEDVVHYLYRPIVRTGLGFGAQRWMATLQRQSEFLGVMKSFIDPAVCSNGERSIGMLAQRMTHNFYSGVCAANQQWEIIQLEKGEDAKLMKRNNIGYLGEPSGTVLSATKTIWFPVKQQRLFEFLTNERTRSQWDVLSNAGIMQLMVHISKCQNIDSNISLFHANGYDTSTSHNNMMILQDTCTDATGSLLVYAMIDPLTMIMVKKNGDPSGVALFPCGISIVPDCFQDYSDNGFCTGSLVTIGFQILVESYHPNNQFVGSAKKASEIISGMIKAIKTSLNCK